MSERRFGFVKWFGGYNSRTERFNNFGFIAAETEDIFIHANDIASGSRSPTEGTLMFFDVVVGRDGKSRAANVRDAHSEFAEISRTATNAEMVIRTLLASLPAHLIKSAVQAVDIQYSSILSDPNYAQYASQEQKIALLKQRFDVLKTSLPYPEDTNGLSLWLNLIKDGLRSNVLIPLAEIPLAVREDARIDSALPPDICVKNLLELDSQGRTIGLIERISQCVIRRSGVSSSLPNHIKLALPVFVNLEPLEQIDMLAQCDTEQFKSRWDTLAGSTKVLAAYRASCTDTEIPVPIEAESNVLAKIALGILWLRDKTDDVKARGFRRVNEIIQDYIVSLAWDLDSAIDLWPLLPSCKPERVTYCEGRIWMKRVKRVFVEEDGAQVETRIETTFCPRLGGVCDRAELTDVTSMSLGTSKAPLSRLRVEQNTRGARQVPIAGLDWKYWSLLEFMDACGVSPVSVDGLRDPREYVNRLGGWVNRLIEIRSRLRCSRCSDFMRPNMAYSKNLARYMSTVVSCHHGEGHDSEVYLNHCWGCESQIIDSRESTIQIDGYYACIACGSGPQQHDNYRQGDVCPKCGCILISSEGPLVDADHGRVTCPECAHVFRTPTERKLTGDTQPRERLEFLAGLPGLHIMRRGTTLRRRQVQSDAQTARTRRKLQGRTALTDTEDIPY